MPSTVIAAFNYYTDTQTLRIRFVSGIVYDYKNVPEEVYAAMKASFSKGAYFNLHIKNNYSFEKIE
jgi:hypothetical protein